MSSFYNDLHEFIWLYRQGFRAVEYIRGNDRISMHPCGWRANGSGRMKTARDAVSYLEGAAPEQWRQIYCGLTPFLVSDRGNVRLIDGSQPKLLLSNGRYQIAYKPEEQSPARRGRRGGMAHKKRVYRSVLVAMAFLDFKKGDEEHEVHHVNGYRTDDRLVNLMVLTHEEHARIHNMGPCGLSAPIDEDIREGDKLEAIEPLGIFEKRKLKKKAFERALQTPDDKQGQSEDSAPNGDTGDKPGREAITAVEAPLGTYAFAPLPEIGELGTFETSEAVEIAQAKEAIENEQPEEAPHQAEEPSEESDNARGNHSACEESSLKAAEKAGLSAVHEQLEGKPAKTGIEAQEHLKSETPSKSARRRARQRRKKAEMAQAQAAEAAVSNDCANEADKSTSLEGNTPSAIQKEGDETQVAANPIQENEPCKVKENEHADERPNKETSLEVDSEQPNKETHPESDKGYFKMSADEQKQWNRRRATLNWAVKSYLSTLDKLAELDGEERHKAEKAAAKAAHKAYGAFLTCPDPVFSFDALLSAIRAIALYAQRIEQDGGRKLEDTTKSLLGQIARGLKVSTRSLMKQGGVVASCTSEMLAEESAKPLYRVFKRSPLQTSLDVVIGHQNAKGEEGDQADRPASETDREKNVEADSAA